jgi:OOP family OmpA-OmpF porin
MRLHTILLLILPLSAMAQPAKWEAGILLGGTSYQGDLVSTIYPDIEDVGLEYMIAISRSFSPSWSLRFSGAYAEFGGQDHLSARAYQFTTTLTQLNATLNWEPLAKRRFPSIYQFNKLISPYAFVGVGAAYIDAQAKFPLTENEAQLARIDKDKNVDYPFIQPILPLGIGVKADLNRRFFVHLEAGTQGFLSDHLDGISESANPEANDWLGFARAGITIRFLPKDSDKDGIADEHDACPEVKGDWSAVGCPDKDKDGVEDLEDLCPEIAGTAKLNGCPDTDKDGVADRLDSCPYQYGSQATDGCPDWDEDGLADKEDECPYLPGSLARKGCPILDTNANGSLSDEHHFCRKNSFDEHLDIIQKQLAPQAHLLQFFLIIPEKEIKEAPNTVFDF